MPEEEKPADIAETKPAEAKPTEPKPGVRSKENIVYIGKKGIMSYVLAVVTQFNSGVDEVSVKARGRAISRAVDVAEIIKNRFINEVKIKDIKIQTEELDNEDGSKSKVSAIDITLAK